MKGTCVMIHALAALNFDKPQLHLLMWSIIYGVIGIVLTIGGYKIFDWITPIDVEKELSEKQNIAVAIVCAAVIIGVALVVAAAIG
jgi:putative membrane protein